MVKIDNIPLVFKHHKLAKRMKLRYDASCDHAVITMPPRTNQKEAINFATRHLEWLEKQRKNAPERIYLYPDFTIPYKGKKRQITHYPDEKADVTITDDNIYVGGPTAGVSVRLENYLKKQARDAISPLADSMAAKLKMSFKRIQIRDTKSRWGSCSSTGTLSFSWRLIMTPPEILEYVVAHEISHLVEMNHSPAFWRTVDLLVSDAQASRKWLRSEGNQLMLILSHAP